jgi:hypothetical protein
VRSIESQQITEAELSQLFGLSKTPIRDALIKLSICERFSMSAQADLIERVHQAHGYLAKAEGDLLRLYAALLKLQRFPLEAAENRFQLARDAQQCGVDVQFLCVEHFATRPRC